VEKQDDKYVIKKPEYEGLGAGFSEAKLEENLKPPKNIENMNPFKTIKEKEYEINLFSNKIQIKYKDKMIEIEAMQQGFHISQYFIQIINDPIFFLQFETIKGSAMEIEDSIRDLIKNDLEKAIQKQIIAEVLANINNLKEKPQIEERKDILPSFDLNGCINTRTMGSNEYDLNCLKEHIQATIKQVEKGKGTRIKTISFKQNEIMDYYYWDYSKEIDENIAEIVDKWKLQTMFEKSEKPTKEEMKESEAFVKSVSQIAEKAKKRSKKRKIKR
jgi:hypothetical protein